MNMRRMMIIGTVLVATAAAVGTAVQWQRRTSPAPSTATRTPAPAASATAARAQNVTLRFFKDAAVTPAFSVQTLDGRTIRSSDLRGKVVLVNFWATWCGPCRIEIPDLIALQARYADALEIIGISEDEAPPEVVQRFAAQQGINYAVAMTSAALQRVFPGVNALPTTFVLDREGRLVQKHLGMLDPTITELETRALAGLPINASIEYVKPDQPVGLTNLAQAKSIPGIDLSKLSAEKRIATLQRLNAEACTCGCGLTLAKCRIDDPGCNVSLPIARRIAAEIAAAQ